MLSWGCCNQRIPAKRRLFWRYWPLKGAPVGYAGRGDAGMLGWKLEAGRKEVEAGRNAPLNE